MKKQYIAICFIFYLFYTNVLFAQVDRPRRVEIGIFAGPSIDWAVPHTNGYKSTGAKAGGVYGINVDINLVQTSSNYFFSTGINARHIRYGLEYPNNYSYFDDATNQTNTLRSVSVNSTFNTVYVTIPTAIKLKTTNFGRFVFWGLVGLEHGIAVSSKSNDEVTNSSNGTREGKFEKVDQYKNTAIFKESLYIILGAEFIIQDNTKATFGIAYDHGFNNMFREKYKNLITGQPVKAYTHCIEFQFGVIF